METRSSSHSSSSSLANSAPLHRSASQVSNASSIRSNSRRRKSSKRKLMPHLESSASSIAASDKSLTSFPSLSPESPCDEDPSTPGSPPARKALGSPTPRNPNSNSIVSTLMSSDTMGSARDALFEDTPLLSSRKLPGALHLVDDDHIERLISRHGAVQLVRQVAEDLAQRDNQVANQRRRADDRERALRKIILECGLSNMELEARLRAVESEFRAQERAKRKDGGLSDMMNDAMQDSMDHTGLGIVRSDDTVRASSASINSGDASKGTLKAWKEYIWGTAPSRRGSRPGSVSEDTSKTAIRGSQTGDRRPALQDDLFTPPDSESLRSTSRASSISGKAARKPSASLASRALQLVAGKHPSSRDMNSSTRGRSNSAGQGALARDVSIASTNTDASARTTTSTQGGPKSLMAMRRTGTPTPTASAPPRSQPRERWDSLGAATPPSPVLARPDNSGPVEMDTIFSPEGQPPTLTHIYNNYNNAEYLTDKFGFIYDQRRKKRQREAAQVAKQMKRGSRTEPLSGARSGISPSLLDEPVGAGREIEYQRSSTPTSIEEVHDQSRPKRWQDYLKIATAPTELLSHTPSLPASSIQVLEGDGQDLRSPGITTEDRGFVPPASTTTALETETAAVPDENAPAAALVHEDAEPVKMLLQQLSDVHDALQKDKTVRWNEFHRKVRAERRRDEEAATAAAAAAAEARFQKAPVMIPEAKLIDGETIGFADVGIKGKVGRAKWLEFRSLVLGGIPVANRPKVWSECSGAMHKRIPGYYEELISRPSETDDADVISQIEMDINRTLTDNIFFRRGPGVAKLSEVLRAYARRNPEVGYCQGMNLITANLLLIMPSTEDTFWILVSIVESILPKGYYDHSLLASRADQQVLRLYVTQVLPKLSQHLEDLSIELEALTFQWFLSVFTDCLSAEALFRVWDVVLCINDGSTFLFQVALALLKLNERSLLACDSPAAVYTYINHQMTNHAISIDGLIQASEGLRKVVRREDVEEHRARAIAADEQMHREREEARNQRLQAQNQQKAASAPALVTETSASALPSPGESPALQGEDGPAPESNASAKSLGALPESLTDDSAGPTTPLPPDDEVAMGLG